jgi:hypothetical protein
MRVSDGLSCASHTAIRRSLLAIGAAAVLALAVVPAAMSTTDPGKDLIVYVNITDKGIKLATFLHGSLAGQNNLFVAQPARGQTATFEVHNLGKKIHSFKVFGKQTPKLKPGGRAHFTVALLTRGRFTYDSPVDKGKARFRGVFNVL